MAHNFRTSSFKYRSPTAVGNDHYVVEISVKDLTYSDGKKYMDIGYKFTPVVETKGHGIYNHPFYNNDDFLGNDGEVIAKNPMTSLMVDYLLMDDMELSEFSGHTTPQKYKHNIMLSILHFWD